MNVSTGAGVRFHENGLLDVSQTTGKYLQIARQNQQESPLLRLPSELRHSIFEYVLGGKTFKIIYDSLNHVVKNTSVSKHALALLAVCRQIFAETALLPFSLNEFSARHPENFYSWTLSLRPAFAEAITTVHLHYHLQVSRSGTCSSCWYQRYGGEPRSQEMAPMNNKFRLPSLLTSVKSVQLTSIIGTVPKRRPRFRGKIDWESVAREEKDLKEYFESQNSNIKVSLTPRTV